MLATVAVPARAGRIDARVAAPGPHDFAVRCGVSSGAEAPDAASVHRNPRQRVVTIAIRPLMEARDGGNIVLICVNVKRIF